MKYLFIPALLSLMACTDSKDSGDTSTDTDDTDTGSVDFGFLRDGSGNVIPTGAAMDCGGSGSTATLTYTVTASPSLLEVDMTETDDSYLYTEYHDGFSLVTVNADNSETWQLTLEKVTAVQEVVANQSTLFCIDTVVDGTTWYFGAVSADGMTTDCVVTGDNTGYYSKWCTNVE